MRRILVTFFGASLAVYVGGCTASVGEGGGGVSATVDAPSVEVDAPVIDGPGVIQIDTEPPPAERVYVYDEGFPPGVYLYGGFYYYNGYRYDHDVFVNRFVHENITNHRYVNVEENRRAGQQIEGRQKADFQRTGGKHQPKNVQPAPNRAAEHPETPAQNRDRAVEHPQTPAEKNVAPERPVERPANTPEHRENVTPPAKTNEHPEVKPENRPRPEEKTKPKEEEKKDEK